MAVSIVLASATVACPGGVRAQSIGIPLPGGSLPGVQSGDSPSGATPSPDWDEARSVVLNASQAFSRDDNLLRLPSSVPVSSVVGRDRPRGDTVSQTTVGTLLDGRFGRQRVRFAGQLSALRFSEYSSLNHEGHQADLDWDWEAGSAWSGTAGAQSSRVLSSPADTSSARKNLVDLNVVHAQGRYRLTPSWHAVAGLEVASRRNSAFTSADLRQTGVEAGADRDAGDGLLFSARLRHLVGRFDNLQGTGAANDPLGTLVDNRYRQQEALARVTLDPNDVSRFVAEAGWVRRMHDTLSQRDFSGPVAEFDWAWRPTAKLSVPLVFRREVGQIQDLVASYVDSRIASVEPAWDLSAKWRLQASLRRVDRLFKGDPGVVVNDAPQRRDRTNIVGLSARYEIIRALSVFVEARDERRDSNNDRFDYRARVVYAALRASW